MPSFAHALAESRRFLCHEDVDLIGEAAAGLPIDRLVFVVDLGAGSGTTALSVFDVRSFGISMLTVDHDPIALASTKQCMTNAKYVHLWQGFEMKSWEAAEPAATSLGFLAGEIDFLMIDASHEGEDVRKDLAAWLPLVRPGAPVWAHDYTDLYPGVIEAIDEYVAAGKLEFVKTAGWGWLGRKPLNVKQDYEFLGAVA